MGAAWCLFCIVIVYGYSSTLISYLLSPPPLEPLVRTVQDLVDKPNVHLVTEEGLGTYNILMVNIGDKIPVIVTPVPYKVFKSFNAIIIHVHPKVGKGGIFKSICRQDARLSEIILQNSTVSRHGERATAGSHLYAGKNDTWVQ